MRQARVLAGLLAGIGCFASPAPADSDARGKKVLKLFGWDKPLASFLPGHVGEIERAGFDGISIIVKPDIVAFFSHGYWVAAQGMQSEGIRLEETHSALLPAFLDGVLEGCGPRARVVDGGENTYPFLCYQTFADFRRFTDADCLRLTAVPDLYRKHYSRAFGVWPGFPHGYRGDAPLGAKNCANPGTPERFEHSVHNALAAADEYAWVWWGVNCWWPCSAPSYSKAPAVSGSPSSSSERKAKSRSDSRSEPSCST